MITVMSGNDRWMKISHFIYAKLLFSLPVACRRWLFQGTAHHCPICQSQLTRYLVLHRAYHLWCPVCRSLQRHRLVWLFLQQHTPLFSSQPIHMLHVAPEPGMAERFQSLTNVTYLSGDLYDPQAMVKLDVTDLQFPDQTFDMIYCSHVLEHVPDDHQALREFVRVLRPGGWAVILVPITVKETVEDLSITDPRERERLFGQHDHVRRYGLDFESRLQAAGFETRPFTADTLATPTERHTFGLPEAETIYLCQLRNQ